MFTVKKESLADMLSLLVKVCGKSPNATTECVKFTFGGDDYMRMEGTNYDVWMTLKSHGLEPLDCATAIIPCKQFYSIISGLKSDSDVSVSLKGKQMTIKTENSQYKLGSMTGDEWTAVEFINSKKPIKIKADDFIKGLAFAVNSSSSDTTRHYLNGVCICSSPKKKLRFLGCDGYKVSHYISDVDSSSVPEKGVILSTSLASLLISCTSEAGNSEIELELTEAKCRVGISLNFHVSIISRLVEAIYPDLDRVIPYDTEKVIMIMPRGELTDAVRRIYEISQNGKSNPVVLSFQDNILKLTSAEKADEGEETITARCAASDTKTKFNSRLLHQLLNSFDDDEIVFMANLGQSVGGNEKSFIITNTDEEVTPDSKCFSILMPMAV